VIKGARNENENVRKRKKIIIQKGGVAMKSKLGSFIISLIAVFLFTSNNIFAQHFCS